MFNALAAHKAESLAKRLASSFLPKVKEVVMDQIKSHSTDLEPLRN